MKPKYQTWPTVLACNIISMLLMLSRPVRADDDDSFDLSQSSLMGIGEFRNKSLVLLTWTQNMFMVPWDNYDAKTNCWAADGIDPTTMSDTWKWIFESKEYKQFQQLNTIRDTSFVRTAKNDYLAIKGSNELLYIDLDSQKITGPVNASKIRDYGNLNFLSFVDHFATYRTVFSKLILTKFTDEFDASETIYFDRCNNGSVILGTNESDCNNASQGFIRTTNGYLDHNSQLIIMTHDTVFSFPLTGGILKSVSKKIFFTIEDQTQKKEKFLKMILLVLAIIIALVECCLLYKCYTDNQPRDEEMPTNRSMRSRSPRGGGTGGPVTAEGPSGGGATGGAEVADGASADAVNPGDEKGNVDNP